MRIVGRSESPSFPSLETLLPMEKSWALEVERDEQALCLQGKNERLDGSIESTKLIDSSWILCKGLSSGCEDASHRSHERENERYGKRSSRSFDSELHRNDQCHDSSRLSGKTRRAWQFTSSSRCYPPSVKIRSSEFPGSAEDRTSRLQAQRGWHEARRFVTPNKTSNSFARRQCSTRSTKVFSRESKGGKPSANTFERRHDRFGCLNQRAEMTSSNEASEKHRNSVGDDLLHLQDHQELDECKHESQPSFDKHNKYRHGQYSVKSEFPEWKNGHRYAKKREHPGTCHSVDNWKSANQCGLSIDSEMNQHNEATLAVQSLEEKPEITNDKEVASEAITTKVLSESVDMFESSCIEESEINNEDSVAAKKQYEMLACLLFDDLQDLDEGFDGPGCEYSGSIFDDELLASRDIDVVNEGKETKSGMIPAACITEHSDCKPGKASAVKFSADQHAKTPRNAHTSSGLKKSPPVLVDVTNKFEIHNSAGIKGEVQEEDAHRLSQRQRQIEFGKNTLGYERYSELIPRFKRKAKDPQTPNPKQVCSKRSWDGQIRKWRRLLHAYDPPSEDGEEMAEDFSVLKLHQSNLEEKGPDAKQDTRCAESDKSKGCIAGVDRENVGDANLTIYDDWIEL